MHRGVCHFLVAGIGRFLRDIRFQRDRTLSSPFVEAGVADRPGKQGFGFLLRLQGIPPLPEPHETVLQDIIGAVRIRQHAHRYPFQLLPKPDKCIRQEIFRHRSRNPASFVPSTIITRLAATCNRTGVRKIALWSEKNGHLPSKTSKYSPNSRQCVQKKGFLREKSGHLSKMAGRGRPGQRSPVKPGMTSSVSPLCMKEARSWRAWRRGRRSGGRSSAVRRHGSGERRRRRD